MEKMTSKRRRGFAAMDPERRKEIASKGGRSVPASKRAFSTSRDLAAEAGRKGGQNIKPEGRSFSLNRALASSAGKRSRKAV